MKKRILSALLALVMVLALLPATVFAAAAETGKTSVRYYDKVQPNLKHETEGQDVGPGWFFQTQVTLSDGKKETRYAEVTYGVVTGTSTSGTWYESAEAALAKGQTSFTLLSNQTISGLNRNLTVDTNGSTLNISGADMTKVTSLTVTDARYAAAQKAGLSGSQGSVNWSINNDSNGTQSFTLTLRNGGKLSGSVTLINPANHTITMTDYAKIEGSVNMSGNATNTNAQNVSLSNNCEITQLVTLTGNSSRVNVASSKLTGGLKLTGTGTQLKVDGIISKVGAVTLNSAQSKTTGTNATVNISQGHVESITQTTDNLKSNIKITVGENGSVGAITIENGADITVNQGSTGAIDLPSGTLTVNGPSARLGALTLNRTGNTTFKVAGTGNSITSVSASNGASLKVDIAAEISNTFGAVSLDGYKGHGIKGGTYKGTAPTADALANSGNEALIYQCVGGGSTTFYTSAQLADGLYKQATKSGTLTIVGQTTGTSGTITFKRGSDVAGVLTYQGVTTIPMLPNKALGTPVATWTDTTNKNKTYNAGGSYDVPQGVSGTNFVLATQGASQVVTKINGLNLATGTGANHNITASLNGNVITLSGAVEPIGGIASFQLNLLTDLVDENQKQVIIPVWVNYNSVNKRTYFGNQTLDGGLTVNADGSRLTLFDGSTYYTLNGSGLRVMDENFKTQVATDGKVKATYTGTGDAATKQYVANLIQGTLDGDTAASFDWSRSTAVKQAVNAVQAGITSSQVQNWRDQAQRKAWQNHYSGSPTKDQYTTDSVSAGYTQVWLVPYLNVTASKYNKNGTLTAALSVYYRVEVRSTTAGQDPIEVQAGRALGTLGEEFDIGVVVKFGSTLNTMLTAGNNNAYMRQDDTYVYKNDAIDGNKFTISHSGRTGLGTIVIDQTAPLVMLERSNGATNTTHVGKGQTAYYTTLQAAVNDTQPQPKDYEDRITVLNGYKASDSIDVTGLARTFYIKAEGNTTLTRASNNFTMTPDKTGSLWTVQLAKETATGTVAIYVTDVANGNASASIVRAKAGDTVTITTNPNSGYYTLGVSAVGSNNTSIAVSGSGNSWSFKVPDNVVSVTVTPNFGVGGGQVSINVNNATNGSATVSSGTNNVTQGSTITVYTVPRAGYRATGVSVYFNNGTSVNATNTGTNTWVFTVPAGATTATVTPSFTVETGLPFTDVGSNDFYLQYVNFVYKHGMMEGFGNKYTFNGNGNVTRAQIVLILYRLSGSPSVSGVTKFSDVPANQWYSAAVAWASNNNIVNGRSNSIFDPGTAVTRQELAAILYRYNNYRGLSNGNLSNLSQFTDRGYVQSYAKEAMQWAVGNGIISGTTNTTLSPNGTAIRYQAAAMLTRYCQNFLKMS